MKIELIKTKERDGEWYKVYVDGICEKCYGFKHIPEEEAKLKAEAYFNNCVKYCCKEVEIIKSVEI